MKGPRLQTIKNVVLVVVLSYSTENILLTLAVPSSSVFYDMTAAVYRHLGNDMTLGSSF